MSMRILNTSLGEGLAGAQGRLQALMTIYEEILGLEWGKSMAVK
jgi:hypothetical protein